MARHTHILDPRRGWIRHLCGVRTTHVYTRTGDMGQSSLFNGERRHKDDPIFDALGSVDELNAAVGMAYVQCEAEYAGTTVDPSTTPSLGDKGLGWLLPQLKEIQMRLLDVGSLVATPLRTSPSERLNRVSFDGVSEANKLERYIDAMDAQLPPLTVFILPGGGAPSASLHFARAVCRRAELTTASLPRVSPPGVWTNRRLAVRGRGAIEAGEYGNAEYGNAACHVCVVGRKRTHPAGRGEGKS
eukprot:scaffold31574_cov33-Tisochrysis_lutea.AAC.1